MPTYKRRKTLLTLVTSYDDCPVDISKNEYLKITEGFMKFISSKIKNGKDVNLPANYGNILIVGKKNRVKISEEGYITGVPVDWKSTLNLWNTNEEAKKSRKRIFFFNEHTNSISYSFKWLKGHAYVFNKHLYQFTPTRTNKRDLWKSILGGKEYKTYRYFYESTTIRTQNNIKKQQDKISI